MEAADDLVLMEDELWEKEFDRLVGVDVTHLAVGSAKVVAVRPAGTGLNSGPTSVPTAAESRLELW